MNCFPVGNTKYVSIINIHISIYFSAISIIKFFAIVIVIYCMKKEPPFFTKLYEELLDNKEEVLKNTLNEKIMIGKDRKHDFDDMNDKIIDLLTGMDNLTRNKLVEKMMYIVPEFISMNSYYGNEKNIKPINKLNLTEPILNTHSSKNREIDSVNKEINEQELHLK